MTVLAMAVAAALCAGQISVEHHGTLREALNGIAQQGGLSLVITGDLSQPAEVVLKDVTAEEAIEAVAQAYELELSKQGRVWVLKPRAALLPAPTVPGPGAVAAAPPSAPAAAPPAAAPAPEAPESVAARAEAPRSLSEKARARLDEARARLEATGADDAHMVSTGQPLVVPRGKRVETAVAYGGGVTVEEGAVVEDDVVAFGGDVVLEQGAQVEGDAVAFGGEVKKAAGAQIGGEVVSMGAKTLGATVAHSAARAAQDRGRGSGGGGVAGFLLRFAVLFGLGFVFMVFAPQRVRALELEIQRAPAVDGAMGLLAFLGLIPATVLLALTIVGIPVAVLLWPLVALVSLLGLTALANLVGARLPFFKGRRTQAVVLAVGVLALSLAALVPVLGPLFLAVAFCISFGAVLRTRLGFKNQSHPTPDPVASSPQP